MNNFLLEPITFIGFATVLAGFEAGIGSAALMGGVLACVDKMVDVEPIVKDSLGKYMTSKGFEASYIEQVSKIACIALTCLIAASISNFCGIVQLSLIKTFGLMVATYTFKLGVDLIVKKVMDLEEKKIQEKKELLQGAGELLKGTDSAIKSLDKMFDPEVTANNLDKMLNRPGIKAGTAFPGRLNSEKKPRTIIKNGEIIKE